MLVFPVDSSPRGMGKRVEESPQEKDYAPKPLSCVGLHKESHSSRLTLPDSLSISVYRILFGFLVVVVVVLLLLLLLLLVFPKLLCQTARSTIKGYKLCFLKSLLFLINGPHLYILHISRHSRCY